MLLSNLFVCTYLSAYASILLSLYLHRPVARGPPPPPSCRPAVRRPAVHRPANHRLVRHPPPPRAFCPPSAADRHRPPCRTRPWGRISSRRPAIQRPWVATVVVSCSPPPSPLKNMFLEERNHGRKATGSRSTRTSALYPPRPYQYHRRIGSVGSLFHGEIRVRESSARCSVIPATLAIRDE